MSPKGQQTTSLLLQTRRFRVEQVAYVGAGGATLHKDVIRHPGAVTILPLVDAEHVCLIRNYRVAIGERLIELPAGTLEPPEDPATTACRELIEETGYRAERLEYLHAFYLSPGILDEQMHLYLATGLTPGGAELQPDEQIENLVVPWEDALRWVDDGTIRDAKTIVGLLYYERRRRSR